MNDEIRYRYKNKNIRIIQFMFVTVKLVRKNR